MLKIERVAEISPVRENVYRRRYAAYVGACQEYRDWLDHGSRAVRDDLDESGHVYGAFVDGELVGTVRSNYSGESDLDEYFAMVGIDPAELPNASVTARLAVAPGHRGSAAAFRLAGATYADGLHAGIRFNVIDCRPFLVAFYERLGYTAYRHLTRTAADSGESHDGNVVMVLDMHDEGHLRRVGSPFLKHYLAWAAQILVAV